MEKSQLFLAVGNSGDFWIGLKKTDGEWQWDDGYPLIYQNWLNDNVTNLKRKKLDCVQDKFYKIWVDRPCSEKASFICQYEGMFLSKVCSNHPLPARLLK